jgi:hypothetical protein
MVLLWVDGKGRWTGGLPAGTGSGRIRVDRVPGEDYAATVKVAWKVALVIVGLLVLAFLARVYLYGHGHIDELLEVTVRVVDRGTGKPVAGAVVATVRYRSQLDRESFDWHLETALGLSEHRIEDSWECGAVACATRTTDRPKTVIRSSALVTRYWFASIETSKTVGIPELLLIDHPRHGRTIIPIDPETPVEEGEEPNTWRLDLGTIGVPE